MLLPAEKILDLKCWAFRSQSQLFWRRLRSNVTIL